MSALRRRLSALRRRPGTALTQQQYAHLNGRINAIRQYDMSAGVVEPSNIRAMRKMVKSFDNAVTKKNEHVQKQCRLDKIRVNQAINFSDAETALKAVQAFEKKWAKK